MATNTPGTRPKGTSSDQPSTSTTPVTPEVSSTGTGTEIGGVQVYDQDGTTTTSTGTTSTGTTLSGTTSAGRNISTSTGSGQSGMNWTWIIGVIVLIIIVYFLLQWIF